MKTSRTSLVLSTSIATFLLGSLRVLAANSTWIGGTSTDWNNPANWSAGLATDNVFVNTTPANIATITANPAVTQKDIFVGQGGGNTGRVDHTAGTVTTSGANWMFIGQGGTGTFNEANTAVGGGALTGFGLGSGSMTNWGRIYVGQTGGNGKMNINTSGTIAVSNDIYVADGGTGVLNMDAGTINNTGGWFVVGQNAGSNGTFNIDGGTVNTTGGQVIVGRNGGTGTFNMTAGAGAPASFSTTGELWVGQDAGSNGTMNVSAGTVSTASWFAVGRANSTGVLNISGTGTVQKLNAVGALELGNAGASNGTVNLNGGSLIVNKVVTGGGTSTFNFNGGTLKATVNEAAYLQGLTNAFVKAGGAVIDTAGFNTTIAQTLQTDAVSLGGGLTKTGAGTLTLTSSGNSYTGATNIKNGTLSIGFVAAGATPQPLGTNNTINLGVAGGSSGTLTYTGGADTLDKNINALGNGSDTIKNTGFGLLTLSGVITKNGTNLILNGGTAGIYTSPLGTITGANPNSDLIIEGGTTTIAGGHTYNGPTIVRNGGTLNASGTFNSAFTVNSGGHLNALAAAEGTLSVPSLALGASSNVDFEFGAGATLNGVHDIITIGNASGLTLGSTGLYLYETGTTNPFTTNGTYTLFDYTTAFTGTLNTSFSIANSQTGKVYGLLNNTTATTIELTIATAVTTEWNNGTADNQWTTGGNWAGGVPNGIGAVATFGTMTAGGSVAVNGPKTVGILAFNNPGSYTITGADPITLNNGFGTPLISVATGSGTQTIATPLALTSATNVAPFAGTTLVISGNVSGAGNLSVTDAGTVVLTGANSYANTNVASGFLNVGDGGTTGTLGSGPATVGTGALLTFNRSNAVALSNNISGAGAVTHAGTGAITYSGTATHTGATTLNGPFISDGTINGTSGIDVESDTTLRNSSSTTVAGVITVAGNASTTASLTIQDSATATATGNVNVAAGASSAGTLNISGTGALTAAQVNIGANSGGTLNMTGGRITSAQLHVGQNTGGTGVVSMSAGTINSTSWAVIGQGGGTTGDFLMSGGTWNQNHTDFLTVGENGRGNFEMSGSSVLNNPDPLSPDFVDTRVRGTNKGNVIVGRNGTGVGTWTIKDTATANIRELRVGDNAGSTGEVFIEGASLVTSSFDLHVGRAGNGTVNINGGQLNTVSGWTQIGIEAGSTGNLNVTAGSTSAREYRVGVNGTGFVDVSGGTLTATQQVTAGVNATGDGTITVRGGGTANFNVGASIAGVGAGRVFLKPDGTINDTGNFIIGNGGTNVGAMTVTGGTMNVNGELWVGQNTGGQGMMAVSAGTVNVNNWLAVGRAGGTGTLTVSDVGVINKIGANHTVIGSLSGIGTVTQTGGQFNSTASSAVGGSGGIRLGENGGGSGLWNISGGTATADFISVGWTGGGTGELRVGGTGLVTAENNVIVGEGGAGQVNLNGGTLKTSFINAGGSAATLTFNGGTLQARGDQTDFIRGFTNGGGHSAIKLEGPGGTIDSNGFRVKIAAGNSVFSSASDTNSTDGQLGAVLTIKGDATLLNDTDKVTLQTQVGDGVNNYLSVHVLSGAWLDDEVGQVLDNLTIDAGGYYELSALNSPPGAPSLAAESNAPGASALISQSGGELAVGAVPEPGTAALLIGGIATVLGLRRRRA